jgi:uroporphyrinogen decarboxylase
LNSKERVLAAFEHCQPDRVPMWYGADRAVTEGLQKMLGCPDEEALMRRLHVDFRRVRERYVGPPLRTWPDGRRETFWGVVRAGAYFGQPIEYPLAGVEHVEDLGAYRWPSPDWFDFSHVREDCRGWEDKAVIGGPWAVVYTDSSELIGPEEFLLKLHTNPEIIEEIQRRVADFYFDVATRFFEAADGLLDIFFFGDDFGGQNGLQMSPATWRRFMKPNLKRFVDLGKGAGLKVMLHSCGGIRQIIPDLIEIGIDALNPVQVMAAGMEPSALKRDFGDRICFHGAIDHQHVLPNGTPEEVRAEVRRIVDIMAPGGGYCLAPSHDLLLAEFPLENIVAMYDEGYEYGGHRT